jgi:succinyl-diaminopimelate desuccinylase
MTIMPPDPAATALARRTLDLVDIASPSRSEAELYRYVKAETPLALGYDDGESLLYAKREGRPLVLLAGHTDTVPAQGNLPGRIAGGEVHGLGASDMKGGLAVMIELARHAAGAQLAYDLGLLFFPREELGPSENPLPGVFAAAPMIDEAALVICLEPTDNTLQLGCLGNINARVVFEGRAAHSARPWLGVNAITRAFEGLGAILSLPPNDVEVEGLEFREVLSVTQIDDCGNASNVIPARVECTLNFRYAPSRTPAEAEARLAELLPVPFAVLQHSPAAHVAAADSPLLARLRASGGFAIEPKQAWTNVADFAARGLDAVNLGPGATRHAHTAGERVEIAALERTFAALRRFLSGGGAAPGADGGGEAP